MPKTSAQYRDARRAHILAAARRCFAREGFAEASMNELVLEAGISSGAFYRYFASKDAVIAAIAAENLDEIDELFRDAAATSRSAVEAMAIVLEAVIQRHSDDGFAEIALQVWSRAGRSADIANRLTATVRAARDALAASREIQPSEDSVPTLDQLASLLLCLLPGCLLGIATIGHAAVAGIPATLRNWLSDGRPVMP